jgi:hypothetical protein
LFLNLAPDIKKKSAGIQDSRKITITEKNRVKVFPKMQLDDFNPMIAYLTYGSVQYTGYPQGYPFLDYWLHRQGANPAHPSPFGFKLQVFHILRDQVFRGSNP